MANNGEECENMDDAFLLFVSLSSLTEGVQGVANMLFF